MTHTFVLASHNPHKVVEVGEILSATGLSIEVIGYDGPEPIESGRDFAENALIKARAAAEFTGLPSLADDSGLCVDVMAGMPGIFSARWAGTSKDDAANVKLLLSQLADVPEQNRAAHFNCTIALVYPARDSQPSREVVVSGQWHGSIARAPRGEHGFGYDPVFIPHGMTVTAAELSPEQKNALSHRSRALTALAEQLTNS